MKSLILLFLILFLQQANSQVPVLKYTGYKAKYCTDVPITPVNITSTGGASQPQVSSFAGYGVAGYVDGPDTSARFYYPSGICIDKNDNIFIADQGNNRIRKITMGGLVSTFAGSAQGFKDSTGTLAKFYGPATLTADTNGDLYVSDYYNHKIRKITPSGVVTTFAGSTIGYVNDTGTKAKFNGPAGIVFDSLRNLIVVEQGNHKLRRITPDAVVSFIAGSIQGNLNGTGSAARFSDPFGVCVSPLNNTYFMADLTNNRIRRVTSGGQVTTVAGGIQGFFDATGTSAQFFLPTDIKTDHLGNFYIADLYNHRIRKMTTNYKVTTMAGSGAIGIFDTMGEAAKFNGPAGIAFSNNGTMFVVDQLNHMIRKLVTYTVAPPLPAGLTLNVTTGTISGTPTVVTPSTTYVVTGSNLFGTDTACITFSTGSPTPTVTATQMFCNQAVVSDLIPNAANIKWYDTATAGSPMLSTDSLKSGKTYYTTQTLSSCESKFRSPVFVTFNKPIAPTAIDSQIFCISAQIKDLTVTGSNVLWYDSVTAGNIKHPDSSMSDGKTYYASQTISGCESKGRAKVKVTILNTPAPSGSQNQFFCSSKTISDLVVTGTAIKWYDSLSNGNVKTASDTLVSGLKYYASQTLLGCESKNRLMVNVTITIATPPTANAAQSFCNGATINDLQPNGAAINWYDSLTGGSIQITTDSIILGKTYYATQTINSCESKNRTAVTATILKPNPPTGLDSQLFCYSGIIKDLSLVGSNIQWYDSLTGGSLLSKDSSVVNGKTYYATQTVSGCESKGRKPLRVVIISPVAPTGPLSQKFCGNAIFANLTATGTSIRWYDTITGGLPYSLLANMTSGKRYYATQTISGCESKNRMPVDVTLTFIAPPTGNPIQTFCNAGKVIALKASGNNINWYATPSGGSPIGLNNDLVSGNIYYAEQEVGGCFSTSRLAVTANIVVVNAPSAKDTQQFCNSGLISQLVASGSNINWFKNPTGGTLLSLGSSVYSGNYYYAEQSVNGCISKARYPVLVILANTSAPTGATQQVFCNKGLLSDLIVNGSNIAWYDTIRAGTPLPLTTDLVDGKRYYASMNPFGCESALRLAVTAIVVRPDTAIKYFNNGMTVAKNGTNYQWYICDTGYTLIPGANEKTYYPKVSGSYAIQMTHLGCTGRSSCYKFNKVYSAIKQLTTQPLEVYPNPTNKNFTINMSDEITEGTIMIYNVEGKCIMLHKFTQTNRLNVSLDAAAGVYMIKVLDPQQVEIGQSKLILE